jgi:hypothetical protein
MAVERTHHNRRRRPRRRPPTKTADGVLTSVVRLGIGAWSLSAEELGKRLVRTGAITRTRPARGRPDASASLGYLAAGLAIDSARAVSRWLTWAGQGGRRSAALVDAAGKLPGIHVATVFARRPIAGYRSWMGIERRRGRLETERGRRMVTTLVRETTSQSVKGIADTALKEVAHSPEVAALVRSQSTGIATGTILEVRANSEEADDRVEQRVRSWLRIRGDSERQSQPAQPSSERPSPGA